MPFTPLKPKIAWFDERLGYWGKPVIYMGGDELEVAVDNFIDMCDLPNIISSKKALRSLILNLYFIDFISDGDSCLKILLGHKNTSTISTQYETYGAAHSLLSKIVHSFRVAELILYEKGVAGPGKAKGHCTKIKLTQKGTDLFPVEFNADLIYPQKTVIICKDINNARTPPAPSMTSRTKEIAIKKYNDLLVESIVSIGDKKLHALEKTVYRVFNNKSCNEDGRLYGALHQRVPKELRRAIIINGQPTIEVDICSTHPTFIYSMEGIDLTGSKSYVSFGHHFSSDIYQLSSFTPHDANHRNIVKKVMVVMINALRDEDTSDEQFAKQIEKIIFYYLSKEDIKKAAAFDQPLHDKRHEKYLAYSRPSFWRNDYGYMDIENEEPVDEELMDIDFSVKDIVMGILKEKKEIYSWFGSEAWKILNFYESKILLDVVKHFTDKAVPILTIHDSVRIAAEYEEELITVFQNSIEKGLERVFTNKENLLSVDKEPSSYDISQQNEKLRSFRRLASNIKNST
jgi:hypothetical protein